MGWGCYNQYLLLFQDIEFMAAFGKHIAQGAQRRQEQALAQGKDETGQALSEGAPAPGAAAPAQSALAQPPQGQVLPAGGRPTGASTRPGGLRPSSAAAPPSTRPSGTAFRPARLGQEPVQAAQPPASPAASPPPSQAPSPTASRPAPAAPAAFGRPAAEPAASSPATGAPAASPATAPPELAGLFTGYVRQVSEQSRRADGLPLRLERLVDEASDHMGLGLEQREAAKARALSNPAEWTRRLSDYYRETILPARQGSARSLEEARQKNPGKIVYLEMKAGQGTIKVLARDSQEARDQGILDGATVETVSSSRTPFLDPAQVFGRQAATQVIDAAAADEAFAAPRTPKP